MVSVETDHQPTISFREYFEARRFGYLDHNPTFWIDDLKNTALGTEVFDMTEKFLSEQNDRFISGHPFTRGFNDKTHVRYLLGLDGPTIKQMGNVRDNLIYTQQGTIRLNMCEADAKDYIEGLVAGDSFWREVTRAMRQSTVNLRDNPNTIAHDLTGIMLAYIAIHSSPSTGELPSN